MNDETWAECLYCGKKWKLWAWQNSPFCTDCKETKLIKVTRKSDTYIDTYADPKKKVKQEAEPEVKIELEKTEEKALDLSEEFDRLTNEGNGLLDWAGFD